MQHRCWHESADAPPPPPTRIKSEHLFRQLVSTTGGMQPTSSRAEVTERAGLYTKSCVQGLGYNKIRVWDWQQLCHFAGGVFHGLLKVHEKHKLIPG